MQEPESVLQVCQYKTVPTQDRLDRCETEKRWCGVH